MTQSADQQLVDSPAQGTEKPPARNFSADAFRALTQRLKSPATPGVSAQQQPQPASTPPAAELAQPIGTQQVATTTIDLAPAPPPSGPEPVAPPPAEPVVTAIEGVAAVSPEPVAPKPVQQPMEATTEQSVLQPDLPAQTAETQSEPEPVAPATMINLDGGGGPLSGPATEASPNLQPAVEQPQQLDSSDPLAAAMALISGGDVTPDQISNDAWQDGNFETDPLEAASSTLQAPGEEPATLPDKAAENLIPSPEPIAEVETTTLMEPAPSVEQDGPGEGTSETTTSKPDAALTPPIDIVVFDQQPANEAPDLLQEPVIASEPVVAGQPDENATPVDLAVDISSAFVPEPVAEPAMDEKTDTVKVAVEPDELRALESDPEPVTNKQADAVDDTADIAEAPSHEPVEQEQQSLPKEAIKQDATPALAPTIMEEAAETPVEPVVSLEPDEKSGETARALLDMMSAPSGAAQPQERALAADTLLQLIPTMPKRDLLALSERVCMMEDGPQLLVQALINHPDAKVAQPLLENAPSLGDQELLKLAATSEVDRLIMIAKRRRISSGVVDALIARGETPVNLTIVRNPGAQMSHDAFIALSEEAKSHPNLQAPLATRGDTPPPIAFELFWSLPIELRRYVLSRFLTDSATLDKILKIAQSIDSNRVESDDEPKFPPKARVEEFIAMVADGFSDRAADLLAELGDVHPDNARRIIADPDGEPITVALKTIGCSRSLFSDALKRFSTSTSAMLSPERNLEELSALFDSLSFNKARTLMKYWDWAIEKSGPYTRRMM